ncbi:MAG: TPM domain-containing protein [Muribaculaceae bacterium]|nr:TPM domain-containing protein [Muribaculaceae bacterium]
MKYIVVFLILLYSSVASAVEFPRNPRLATPSGFVSDPAGVLSAETVASLNHALAKLRMETTVQMGVAVVPTVGEDMNIQEYSVELFEKWGLGNTDNDNGLLMVVDTGGNDVFITTGYGCEGVFTDALCHQILMDNYRESGLAHDYDAAISNTVSAIIRVAEIPSNAKELRSGRSQNGQPAVKALEEGTLLNFIGIVIFIIFIFAVAMFISDISGGKKLDNYERALRWKRHLSTYWVCALCTLGLALPFALIARANYKRNRDKKRICDTCGTPMNKLDEHTDNEFLSAGQDFEENLGTVDYDVWLCPKCGTIERFPFLQNQTQYTRCPACHTVAMCLKSDRIVRPATTRSEGMGVKTYECLFCHHRDDRHYRLPRKEDTSGVAGAMAAGAIIGALGSRRDNGAFGGGNFGGGNFGGGHTGGGGAGLNL